MQNQPPIQPENVQPTTVDAPTEGMAAPIQEPATAPVADGTPVDTTAVAPEEQTQAQDEQIIETVAQGLADEEITAADIMTAVLSDSLGISPSGAQSLFNLLMSELVDDVNADTTEEVPPETM